MRADAAPSYLLVPELADAGEALDLPAEERHYLFRVCRARSGEEAIATDGRGGLVRVSVEGEGAQGRVRVIAREHHRRTRRCWICCGAPEGSRADWLVEKLAELGIERFQPIEASRGRWSGGASRRRRWERLSTAGLRQSRQVWRMEIADPVPLAELDAATEPTRRILADAGGAAIHPDDFGKAGLSAVLVGPSGGLAPEERDSRLEAGWEARCLSDNVLRTETAALVAAAVWGVATGG